MRDSIEHIFDQARKAETALPAVLSTIGNLQLLILATALASISFFVFFDWEFE